MLCYKRLRAVVLISLSTAISVQAGNTIYVDDDAPPGGGGTTWETAFQFLQDALSSAAATEQRPIEIRVAGGVYYPDQSTSDPTGTGDRSATFELTSQMTLRGGYLRLSAEPGRDPDMQDPKTNRTILNGDLSDDDVISIPEFWLNTDDNSWSVVSLNSATDVTLDGLTIQRGYNDVQGKNPPAAGGIVINGGSANITNCVVTQNSGGFGGAISAFDADVFISVTTVRQNLALEGAGIAGQDSVFELTGAELIENDATALGGGLALRNGSAEINDCDISTNLAALFSGAGMSSFDADMTITDTRFIENDGWTRGGAAYINGGTIAFSGCLFQDNILQGKGFGGAIASYLGERPTTVTITSCTFQGNQAARFGGAVQNTVGSIMTVTDTTFRENLCLIGGALYNDGDLLIQRTQFLQNIALSGGGAMALGGTATALACRFTANHAMINGGAIASPVTAVQNTFINCEFLENSADLDGGAIWSRSTNPGVLSLINCTVAENTAGNAGGGIINLDADSEIAKTILWANAPDSLNGLHAARRPG